MSENLPTSWAVLPLARVADLQLGKMLDKAKNIEGQTHQYLRNVNVRWGCFDLSDLAVMRFTPNEAAKFSIADGDVLVCEGGEPGRAAVWRGGPTPLKFQKALHRVRPSSALLADWIAHYLTHIAQTSEIAQHFTGTTIKHLPAQALGGIEVPIPPPAEQRRIVARIEALFARTRQARADLLRIAPLAKHYQQRVLDSAFREGALDGWPETPLADIATETRNGISAKPANEPPGVPILRISAVRPGRVSLDDVRYHRPDSDLAAHPYLLRDGDLLFVRFNGNADLVAACGTVRGLSAPRVYPDKLIRMRLDPSVAIPEFVEAAVATTDARRNLAGSIKTAAGQHGISGTDLRRLCIALPSVDKQREVASALTVATVSAKSPSGKF
ncbi:restriction endonuclease subunit S [Roseicella frigidaeris]|uniref:Type I restriction modification DNA specificity domain-containing protein n=1 Tax=Roseicella frigidaeris TaxID=2230885 RepID=A0A327M736_9PROT|nr:restriction endonuclease subunit S [Roseicella frigidaeris]RAI59121.1 hypothetical protein DOO78_11385 [Roseicella frigidaeris]